MLSTTWQPAPFLPPFQSKRPDFGIYYGDKVVYYDYGCTHSQMGKIANFSGHKDQAYQRALQNERDSGRDLQVVVLASDTLGR